MVEEKHFRNITVKYNGIDFKDSNLTKIRIIDGLLSFLITLFMLALVFVCCYICSLSDTMNSVLAIAIVGAVTFLVIFLGIKLQCFIIDRIAPKHYNFINHILKLSEEDVEFGEMRGRFIVSIPRGSHGQVLTELGNFITDDFILETDVDRSKPMYMTINTLKSTIEVKITN